MLRLFNLMSPAEDFRQLALINYDDGVPARVAVWRSAHAGWYLFANAGLRRVNVISLKMIADNHGLRDAVTGTDERDFRADGHSNP